MHLLIVMAFGLVLWRADQQPFTPPVGNQALSVMLVLIQPLLWWTAARASSAHALRRLRAGGNGLDAAQLTYHRTALLLRVLVFLGYGAALFLTRWSETVAGLGILPAWSGLADLVAIGPFLLGIVAVWYAQFPIDRVLREHVVRLRQWEGMRRVRVWTLSEYLSFNIRYQMLTVAVPMTVILVTYRLCGYHRARLVDALLFPWVPDALLALVAAAVFVLSPVLLKTIWATAPLAAGPLRLRLKAACRRTGLRCRDILVWDSHGMVINAAVMGVLAPFRYVLLSDGLLEGLREEQIEAVFGHEAGHVRQHHIQYFLLFALVAVLVVSGVVEVLIRFSEEVAPSWRLGETSLQAIGLGLMAAVWGLAFGWVSRRFERQADACGARCVSPSAAECQEPCGVHLPDGKGPARDQALCVTGAKVFAAALDRVALLNGIPHEERSWRHSSIASRMRFLLAQAGDPALAGSFHHLIRTVKRALWVGAAGGLLIAALYSLWQPDYRSVILRNTVEPLNQLGLSFVPRSSTP